MPSASISLSVSFNTLDQEKVPNFGIFDQVQSVLILVLGLESDVLKLIDRRIEAADINQSFLMNSFSNGSIPIRSSQTKFSMSSFNFYLQDYGRRRKR